MAVESVKLVSETFTLSEGVYTGNRVYEVRYTDTTFDADDALNASDGTTTIPSTGAAWKSGSPAKVTGKSAQSTGADNLQVTVTVDYSSSSDAETIENPLARPEVFAYSGQLQSESYFIDTEGNLATNSAGEDFQDLPERLRPVRSFTVTRNVATYDDEATDAYIGLTNSGSVSLNGTSYDARKLLLSKWDATGPNTENDVTFWTETLEFLRAPKGRTWEDVFEDRGRNEKTSDGLKPIRDTEGNPVDLPWPLNGSGAPQADPTDAPAQITLKPYDETSFASI